MYLRTIFPREVKKMLKPGTAEIVNSYCAKSPAVAAIKEPLRACIGMLLACFEAGGKLLVCGNGGSCADADHIVGELVKAFKLRRPLHMELTERLQQQGELGTALAAKLNAGLPAINLGAHTSLMTAMINDVGGDYIFAQQVAAYGKPGDVLLGISTSGNSRDVLYAGLAAKAMGIHTVGLTGRLGGKMAVEFDLTLCAAADAVEDIQDLHSVIYHALCAAVEYQMWGD